MSGFDISGTYMTSWEISSNQYEVGPVVVVTVNGSSVTVVVDGAYPHGMPSIRRMSEVTRTARL